MDPPSEPSASSPVPAGQTTAPPPSAAIGACGTCHRQQSIPTIPMYAPYTVALEPGKTYSWCSCGRSKTQPFCDGSHKGTTFQSVKFSTQKQQKFFLLCGCKYTRDPPYCDGLHALMPANPDHPPCTCGRPTPDW